MNPFVGLLVIALMGILAFMFFLASGFFALTFVALAEVFDMKDSSDRDVIRALFY